MRKGAAGLGLCSARSQACHGNEEHFGTRQPEDGRAELTEHESGKRNGSKTVRLSPTAQPD